MRALSRTLIVAACTGLLIMTTAPGSSTAFQMQTRVQAMIKFVQPATASKISDVSMGDWRAQGSEKVSLATDGTLQVSGRSGGTTGYGQPSVIKFSKTRDTMVNFLPTNYQTGRGIDTMSARCALQASGGQSCMSMPFAGSGARTLYIGIDMTVADSVVSEQGSSTKQPSFDMSIVYQ